MPVPATLLIQLHGNCMYEYGSVVRTVCAVIDLGPKLLSSFTAETVRYESDSTPTTAT
jgi:hypothetical protein